MKEFMGSLNGQLIIGWHQAFVGLRNRRNSKAHGTNHCIVMRNEAMMVHY